MKRSLLTLSGYLPYRLSVAAHAVAALIADSYAKHYRLPIPQWRVLAILHEHGSMTQQDLVPLSTMDKQMISRAARGLQERGWIARKASHSDGRAWMLSLTARGRQVFRQLAPLAVRHERDLLKSMPRHEAVRLLKVLQRLEVRANELNR